MRWGRMRVAVLGRRCWWRCSLAMLVGAGPGARRLHAAGVRRVSRGALAGHRRAVRGRAPCRTAGRHLRRLPRRRPRRHRRRRTAGRGRASARAAIRDQYAEFAHKDAAGAYTNKHALGWTKMTAAARYAVMPPEQRYEMCERCHNIGFVSADGSVGKCDSCHTRHTFSAAEAMEPEACGTCHMGPDHEQIDMYEKSKHGVVYGTERDRAGGDTSLAPTCVTCHMPEGADAGGNAGRRAAHPRRVHQHHARYGRAGRARLPARLCRCRCGPSRADVASVKRGRMEWSACAVTTRLRAPQSRAARTRSSATWTSCFGIP